MCGVFIEEDDLSVCNICAAEYKIQEVYMVLSLVIINEKKKLNNRYDGHYQGLFVTEDGTLCYKPNKKSNICYIINTGEQFEYKNELVHCAYFEGGTRKLYTTTEEREEIFEDCKRKSHPSYGMISFSRENCTPATALFGSSVKHGNPIRMVLSHANIERGLNKDWYHAKGRIVEIEMSQSQFIDAITSLNMGDGVPCTITFTERDGYMPACNFVSKTEQFRGEFSDHLSGIKDNLDENIKTVKEILETRKTLRKSDREAILSAFYSARQNIDSNANFIVNSFNEQMDKTVTEAKGEIESFMQHQVQKFTSEAMLENIQNGQAMLSDNIKNPIEPD